MGSPVYVNTPTATKPVMNPATNLSEVNTKHTALKDLAEKYSNKITATGTIVNNVTTALLSNNSTWLPKFNTCDTLCDVYKKITPFVPPDPFNKEPLELDDSPDYDVDKPNITSIGEMSFELVPPDKINKIVSTFNWVPDDFTSEMWDALFDKIHGDILNGGTGLTESVYNAIIAREQEARRINQDREYSKALNAAGATGFNLPSGHIAAVQVEALRENLSQDQQALDNLTIKDFDLATENTRFAITSGIELEKLLRATWDAIENRGLDAAKSAGEYIIATYSANIEKYKAEWEGVALELEKEKTHIEGIISVNESNVNAFIGANEAYKTKVEAITSKNEGLIEDRKGEISVHSMKLEEAAKSYEVSLSKINAQLEVAQLETAQVIEKSKLQLQSHISTNELAATADEAVSKFYAQLAASALGGINASMSSGSSVTESRGESITNSMSLSEGHDFEK